MPPTRVKPRKPKIISIDTETPGVDFFHGCKPFLVTSCNEDGETLFWEWDVDPLTREVHVLKEDVEQIHSIIQDADQMVLHNAKFDVKALATVIPNLRWPWDKTHDTLIAAHLLGSNYPKNLTDLAMNWLGIDILPFEKSLEHAVKECRKVIQLSKVRVKRFNEKEGRDLFEEQGSRGIEAFDEWRIGEDDDPMLPSGGGSSRDSLWKSDYWLPRAMAKHQDLPQDDPYWTVLSSYANQDSPVTLALWFAMRKEIERRGLWAHYQEGLDVQTVVAEMESRPVTINKKRTAELKKQYETSSQKSHDECVRLSDGEITKMPISGRSNDLNRVVFDKLGLVSNKVTKKNNASMDKYVLEEWLLTLDPSTTQWQFINHLNRYRKRRTALGYLESYQKFWISDEKHLEWANLYMTLNQTGTDTLRFTMANPNGQQVSKKEIKEDGEEGHSARYMFGPAPGREWWSLDYENIELRIPAYVAGEELMIELFERPNDPPYFGSYHLLIFDILHPEKFAQYGVDCKDVFSDTWYGWTKNGNFAVQYGAVAESGTADRAYHVEGAQRIIETRLTKIKALSQRMIAQANRTGYVETLPDKTTGGVRGYPLLCTRTMRGDVKPTVPLSYMIQGSAMGCTRRAMIRCREQCRKWTMREKRLHYIPLQVHDEIVFDLPAGGKNNVEKILTLKSLMESSGDDIGIPLKVSVKYNPVSWDKGIKLSEIKD